MNDNTPATPAETRADVLYAIRDDLETLSGKLSSMAGLAGFAGLMELERGDDGRVARS